MKTTMLKRVGATILAAIMMLAMGTSVMAGNSVSGGSGTNSLVIHKYLEPTTATGLPHDGSEIPAGQLTGLTPLNGITFTVYRAALKSGATAGSTNVNDYNLTSVVAGVTDTDGVLTITGLSNDLYWVQETASATSTDVTAFFVNLPMTNPTGSGTLSTVHVYPKNAMTDGVITKEVYDNGIPGSSTKGDVGDDVTWLISTVIPGEFANADTSAATTDYYRITDVLNKSLTYKSAVVTLGTTTLTATTDYTVTTTANANGTTSVVINFTPAGMAKMVTALQGTSATITVDLTTTINEYAYDGMIDAVGDYVIQNQARYDWDVDSSTGGGKTPDPDPTDPTIPSVTVTGLLILKTDESGNALGGASFKIANGNDAAAGGYMALLEKTTNTNGYAYWADAELLTGFGTNIGIFYAIETVAPAGYTPITGHQAFAALSSTNVSATLTIQNFLSNFDLPLTGGIGTTMFTIGGLLLLAAAGAVTIISRRKKVS